MRAPTDLTGQRFGRLQVLHQSGWHPLPTGKRMAIWRCACDCGATLDVRRPYLTSGDTSSCGCLRRDMTASLKRSHGLAHSSSTYDIWVLMRQRCNNPNASGYRYYGGRGIKVCSEWDSFDVFLQDMGERPAGLTLDRIDPNGDYEPGNCRWATWTTQNSNKRKAAGLQLETAAP